MFDKDSSDHIEVNELYLMLDSLSLSDKIAVIYEGEIVGVLDAKDATENELGLLMSGAKKGDLPDYE